MENTSPPPVLIPTLDDAYQQLQIKHCRYLSTPPMEKSLLLTEGLMQIWKEDNNTYHYFVVILGQEQNGIFDSKKDAKIIAFLSSYLPSHGEINKQMGDLKLALSRPYLNLTLYQQTMIFSILQYCWPVTDNWSPEINQVIVHSLLGDNRYLHEREIMDEKNKEEVDAIICDYAKDYLSAQGINQSFKTIKETYVSAVLQFQIFLFSATARFLGSDISTLKQPLILAEYHTLCGKLCRKDLDEQEEVRIQLLLQFNFESWPPELRNGLRYTLLGIIEGNQKFQNIMDHWIIAERQNNQALYMRHNKTIEQESITLSMHQENAVAYAKRNLVPLLGLMYEKDELSIEKLVDSIPNNCFSFVLHQITLNGRKKIITELDAEHLKALIDSEHQLHEVLRGLDSNVNNQLCSKLDSHLRTLITDERKLVGIFCVLQRDNDCQRIVMEKLGTEHLRTIITKGSTLSWALLYVSNSAEITLIQLLGLEYIKEITSELKGLLAVWERLGIESREIFIPLLNKEHMQTILKLKNVDKLRQTLNCNSKLSYLLEILDAKTQINVLRALGIPHVTTLVRERPSIIFRKLKDSGKIKLMQMLGDEIKQMIKEGYTLISILQSLGNATPLKKELLLMMRSHLVDWTDISSREKYELKYEIIKLGNDLSPVDATYYEVLNYLLEEKEKIGFFSSNTQQNNSLEVAAIKWFLSLLTNEEPYTEVAFEMHKDILNSGQLKVIFERSIEQHLICPYEKTQYQSQL